MAETPSIVCPVCETQQPNAWFCAVCGTALHPLPKHLAGPAPTPALEELEVTVLDTSRLNVAVLEVEGLEPTLRAPVPAPAALLPEVEPTHLELPPVAAEPVPELEPTAIAPAEPETPFAGVSCRACGAPWTPGTSRFCGGCGVRLAIPEAYLRAGPAAAAARPEERTVCPNCSSREQVIGHPCRMCGMTVPAKE